MAGDDEFGYSGLIEWQPGQPFEDAVTAASVPTGPPWHRDPRVLIGLIVAAMAVLVVASVVLLTNGRLGEETRDTEMTLRPTVRTSAVTAPSRSPAVETTDPISSATTTAASDTATTEAPSPDTEGAPEPASSAPAPPTARRETPDEGPRTNVTRNPMSFTPGQIAGR